MFVLLSGENASLCDVLKLQVPPGKDYFERHHHIPQLSLSHRKFKLNFLLGTKSPKHCLLEKKKKPLNFGGKVAAKSLSSQQGTQPQYSSNRIQTEA